MPVRINSKTKNESGQAIAEMCIGLIAVMIVFLGIFFISSLGIDNVRTLISARESADRGVYSSSPSRITEVKYGDDGIPFTGDDVYLTGGVQSAAAFQDTLSGENTTVDPFNDDKLKNLPLVRAVQQDPIYLSAAGIKGSKGQQPDFLQTLEELRLMTPLKTFFGIESIDLSGYRGNQVFMPQD